MGSAQGALTLFYGRVAQAFRDDRVVELKEQLVLEEQVGEGQEGKVKEEGREVKSKRTRNGWSGDDNEAAQILSHEVCGVITV